MRIEDSIENSVELEERSPQSTRLYTKIAIIISTLSLILFFVSVITYQIDHVLGLNVFAATFVPMLILFTVSFYLAVAELLRVKSMGARIAIIISVLSLLATLTFMFFELITYKKIFIAPFTSPPSII